jgi:hypothetical protein
MLTNRRLRGEFDVSKRWRCLPRKRRVERGRVGTAVATGRQAGAVWRARERQRVAEEKNHLVAPSW